jgi:hypothetical protein
VKSAFMSQVSRLSRPQKVFKNSRRNSSSFAYHQYDNWSFPQALDNYS